jgi:aspartyl-tRNA(Asn)/glutamyl-tRNA(Gln) amidotransferase subunit B
MEKGNLRADVNVSVRRPGEDLGTRCEIKNVNSIRFIGMAIDYEARRQIGVIEDGGKIQQETRLFDPVKGETRPMRTKEEAHDYRYFPDPDLLPLELDQAYVDALRETLPELPDARKTRFIGLGLLARDADVLVAEREIADFFEAVLKELVKLAPSRPSAQLAFEACKWVSGTLFGALNSNGLKISESPISPAQLSRIIVLAFDPEFGRKLASEAFMLTWENPTSDPRALLEARGLRQVSDQSTIERMVDEVIAANVAKANQARTKPAMLGWFVGQVMKASGGKANPQAVNELLKAKLGL